MVVVLEWSGWECLCTGLNARNGNSLKNLKELREAATGEEADVIFIRLMIPHHRSGVEMASFAASEAKTAHCPELSSGDG